MAYFISSSSSSSYSQSVIDVSGSILSASVFIDNNPINMDYVSFFQKANTPIPGLTKKISKPSIVFLINDSSTSWLYDTTASRDSDFNIIKALNTNYDPSGGGGWVGTATSDLNMATYDIYNVTHITASGNISASGDLIADNLYIGTGKIYGDESYNNYLTFNNSSSLFKVENKTYIKFDGSNAQREVTVNEGTNDIDFVVKGASNNPLFKTDSATNKIGMHGVGTPTAGLHIADNLFVSGANGHITASGNISASSFLGDGSELTNLQRPISLSVSSHMTASNNNAGFFFEVGAVTCSIQAKTSVSCDVGSEFEFFQSSSGNFIFVTGSGVTLRSKGGALTLTGQYSGATLKKIRDDEWILVGDLA